MAASADSVDVKQAEDSGMFVALGGQTGSTADTGGEGNAANDGNDRLAFASAPLNPLVLGSLGLLALGLALFGLRFAARRLR